MKKNKIVYLPIAADIINSGHLNIINQAKKYGNIVVGIFTDSAIAEYKSLPLINYQQRLEIIQNVKGINKIVKQDTWDFTKNLKKLKKTRKYFCKAKLLGRGFGPTKKNNTNR